MEKYEINDFYFIMTNFYLYLPVVITVSHKSLRNVEYPPREK